MLVTGPPGDQQVQIDLKGSVGWHRGPSAWIAAPFAGPALIGLGVLNWKLLRVRKPSVSRGLFSVVALVPEPEPAPPLLGAGVLYSATIVPCPVTMAVVNVGPTEAKMESLFSEFLQLRCGGSVTRVH